MNLLNNLFDVDNIELVKINKRYSRIMVIIIIIILILFFTKKNNYYINNFYTNEERKVLLVNKEYINSVKESNIIIINDIKTKYNINAITLENDIYLLDIVLDTNVNINNGVYKILLGKESLFDYILRIIKK